MPLFDYFRVFSQRVHAKSLIFIDIYSFISYTFFVNKQSNYACDFDKGLHSVLA